MFAVTVKFNSLQRSVCLLFHHFRVHQAIHFLNHICIEYRSQVLNESFDDIVPIVITSKDGEPKVIRAVLTSSQEDKNLLLVNQIFPFYFFIYIYYLLCRIFRMKFSVKKKSIK